MLDKRTNADAVIGALHDGMTIGIGGWGPRRKPMALVRALLRSDIKELIVVAYGGPEVGMLLAAAKVRKLVYGFVSLDAKELGILHDKVNVNGGGIALGHPLGATGARIMTTLLHEIERRGSRYGLQTMCEGGGQANVTILERL